jgi:hypothetical protein
MEHDLRRQTEPQLPSGRYANSFSVGYNASEFVVDFGQYFPDQGEQSPHTRIVTSPIYARALLDVLHEAVINFEREFGPIPRTGTAGEVPTC